MTMPDLNAVMERYSAVTGIHPVVEMFPSMSEERYEALLASIRAEGLLYPVVVTEEGILLDGRHRLLACLDAEIEPDWKVYHGDDPDTFAFTSNIQRRDLDHAQRVHASLAFNEHLSRNAKEAAKERQVEGGARGGSASRTQSFGSKGMKVQVNSPEPSSARRQARDVVAESAGVSGQTMQRGMYVQQNAPDLFDRMKGGGTSVNEVYREAKAREAARPAVEVVKTNPDLIQLQRHTGETIDYPKPKSLPTFNQTNDQVSWARWTWNPVTGCLHGCKFCYARELANLPSYKSAYPIGFEPLFHHERLGAPKNTRVPSSSDARDGRVFVCSMADLFGEWVPQEWIDAVYDSMLAAPHWRYLTLTKFPQRYRRANVPPHLWAGASIDRQNRVNATEKAMRDLPVSVRWLSLEPLLEPLTFNDLSIFDWIVIGSQSGTNQPEGYHPAFAPPIEWVIDLVVAAREAGCAVYLKPNLLGRVEEQAPGMKLIQEIPQERAR